ncbi:MAG: RNA polymerase subunit sigma-24 [Candidatus Rokuibacteriota bacterium]|nr:MAG: RNA polymerase subunit sigma-24 [Candidatus Rokubacteria bacterium]
MMSEDPELALIRCAQNGDGQAFESLVDEYQGVLYNLALRMTGSSEDARDLTQTAFMKAWRNLASYDPRHRFYSWIYRITLNESLNFVQRRRRHAELDERIVATDPLPEDQANRSELGEHIQGALMELSIEYRLVIVLRHFHNLSYQEIGEVLAVPEKTVRSRLFTARRRLGEVLRLRGVGPS